MRILFYFLMILPTVLSAQKVDFHDGSLSEIMQISKSQNKPVMLMGYATWCPHCNKMKSEVLTDPAVAEFLNANFINVMKDMESGDGISIRKKLAVRTYPTFVFIKPDGQILYRFSNELKAPEFLAELKNALDETKQLPYLKNKFMADVSNSANCLTFIYALKKAGLDAAEPAKLYLATQSESQLVSADNWKIIANGITEIDSREMQHVLKNQDKYAAVSSPIRVEKKIVNIVKEKLTPYAESGDTINYFRARPAAAAINIRKTDSLLFVSDLKIYEITANWKNYAKIAVAGADTFAKSDQRLLKEILSNFSDHVSDASATAKYIAIAEEIFGKKPDYSAFISIAKLYQKTGNKKQARVWADRARAFAVENHLDTGRADAILTQL